MAPDEPLTPARGSTPIEQALLDICTVALKRTDRVGPTDNFFDLGADSINVLSILHHVERVFGVVLSTAVVFDCPTACELAREIERVAQAAGRAFTD